MIWYKFIILSVINEINLLTVQNGVVRSYATTCQGQQLLIKRALFFYRVITLSLLTPINDFSYVIPTCSKWNDITIKKTTHFGWYQLQFDSFNMVDDTPGIRYQGLVLAVHRNECTLHCSSNPNYLVSSVLLIQQLEDSLFDVPYEWTCSWLSYNNVRYVKVLCTRNATLEDGLFS